MLFRSGVKGLGYTTEAPGLGTPKEPKGKYKSSGYGDLDTKEKAEKPKANVQDSLGDKEAKTSNPSKVKEMEVTPQNSPGVKKMPMPGKEKKIKLQEGNLGHSEEWSLEPEGRFWILTYSTMDGKKEKVFNSEDEAKKWIKQNLKKNTNSELWNKLSDDEKEQKLLSVFKDPDDASKYVGVKWDELPDVAQANIKLTEEIKWERETLKENIYADLAMVLASLGGATAVSKEVKDKLKAAAEKGKAELMKMVNQLKGAKNESLEEQQFRSLIQQMIKEE